MVTATLPFRRILRQPLTFIASTCSIMLSFGMTLSAACLRWPANLELAVATAVTCEFCKLALFSQGVSAVRQGRSWKGFLWGGCTLGLAVVFAAGSVTASILCMSQSESAAQQSTLATSKLYGSALSDLQTLDAQITALVSSAGEDMANGYPTRGRGTMAKLEPLRERRDSASAKVAELQKQSKGVSSGTLAVVMKALHLNVDADLVDVTIESLIGSAVELAAFLFMWASTGLPALPRSSDPVKPAPPPRRRGRREPSLSHGFASTQSPLAGQIDLPGPAACRKSVKKLPEIDAAPPSYARNLRYAFGPRTEALLDKLEGHPSHVGCRDLLQRMGEHCLRVGWTNGDIRRDTIRAELREGRDWRTIAKYLRLLVGAGALVLNGDTYRVEHFLAANPTVQRRTQRLLSDRSKNCKRQAKHRARLQSLQGDQMQNVELSASSGVHNAKNPQPTTHAVQAAHAATHQSTVAVRSEPPPCVAPARESKQRAYGAVAGGCSADSDLEHQNRMRRLLARANEGEKSENQALRPLPRRSIAASEALEAALDVEKGSQNLATVQESNPPPVASQRAAKCILAKIPQDLTPVNLESVLQACEKIGLPSFGNHLDDLFGVLSREGVRQPELSYAAYCTAKRQASGRVINPVAHLLAIIRRQRAAVSAA